MSGFIDSYVEPAINADLSRKMVFLAGPRQSGKTTFAKHLLKTAGRLRMTDDGKEESAKRRSWRNGDSADGGRIDL